jgi:LCP family protein required for cell wall assembly
MTSLDLLPLSITRRRLLAVTLGTAATTALGTYEPVLGQESDRYTFLVLGLDTREENADQRSDIIMISRVDPSSNTVRTLSIPRDLYLEIPGYGMDKINAAYQRGLASSPELDWEVAAGLTADTIAHNFGVTIDGVALTDMNRFPAIIDAVGGVDVDNPYAVDDPTWPEASFPAGMIHLDGAQALVFTRTRKMDGDGGRVMRQHLVLEALLEKIQGPDMLGNLPELISSLSGAVRTNIPFDVQARLLTMLPGLSSENLAFANIDDQLWADSTAGGAWIYQGDWNTLPGYVQSWLDGTAG